MPLRRKRSISLAPDLDSRIQAEAERDGVTYSAWLAGAARRELTIRAGLAAVAEAEAQLGAFSEPELAEARAWAREAVKGNDKGSPCRRAA